MKQKSKTGSLNKESAKKTGDRMEWKRTERNRFWGKKKSPPVCTFWVSPSWDSGDLRDPKAQISLGWKYGGLQDLVVQYTAKMCVGKS